MSELRLTARAQFEIRAATRWYAEQSTRTADRFLAAVGDALGQIVRTPRLWPLHSHGARRALLRRFPYWLYYREYDDTVNVVAVVHTRRRADAWRRQVDAYEGGD